MEATRVPAGAVVLVGDGRKALFLRNHGTAIDPRLETEQVLKQENPATRDQGADRPGRRTGGWSGHRTALDETDWHELGEDRFAATVAAALHRSLLDGRLEQLIVIAPPSALGVLRSKLTHEVAERVIAEIPKTLTGREVPAIQRLLTGVD